MSHAPDDLDLQLIRHTQGGLPLVARPYAQIATQLGISEEAVIERLAAMQARGAIRRVAAVPNHYALGYRHNGMTVWDVDDALIDELGQRIGELPFVSHCYRRPRHLPDWRYNLFAMVHGRQRDDTERQIAEIAAVLGDACRAHDVLYSTRILKKTGLRLPE
ncbi:AsnC family transcriptional regulator [Chitinivorax sp. PXF-14]|uniref:siroheme decarboxylase subunit beta n=1 Tax=Chitinivorax sp. PXF-14 TaxID=3230488 RepID=UPI003467DEFB